MCNSQYLPDLRAVIASRLVEIMGLVLVGVVFVLPVVVAVVVVESVGVVTAVVIEVVMLTTLPGALSVSNEKLLHYNLLRNATTHTFCKSFLLYIYIL